MDDRLWLCDDETELDCVVEAEAEIDADSDGDNEEELDDNGLWLCFVVPV